MKAALVHVPLIRSLVRVEPKPRDVADFWNFMMGKYGYSVVNKRSAIEMKVVAEILDLMRVVDKTAFLDQYTTIIPITPFRKVYTPFTVGTPQPGWDLWSQIEVCIHECDHADQSKRAGELSYGWDYLTNTASRAHYEAGGYRCNMEARWRYRGEMPDAGDLSEKLLSYGCTTTDVATVKKQLLLSIPAIKRGGVVEPASRIAFPWLDRRFRF